MAAEAAAVVVVVLVLLVGLKMLKEIPIHDSPLG